MQNRVNARLRMKLLKVPRIPFRARLAAAAAWIICGTAAQATGFERRIPVAAKPRIAIAGASAVSIESWRRPEVSISATAGDEDIRVDLGKKEVTIICSPREEGRLIDLMIRVPEDATLAVTTGDSAVQIRKPLGSIRLFFLTDQVQIDVPDGAEIDLRQAPRIYVVRSGAGPGIAPMTAGRIFGAGPPHVKVVRTASTVVVGRGLRGAEVETVKPTWAARAIASEEGAMSAALRRSHPVLARTTAGGDQPGIPDLRSPADAILRVQSRLVNVNVGVTDGEGRAVSGLDASDFRVYEDGVEQKVTHFSVESTPFNLVLLVDSSGSVRANSGLIKDAVLHFLDVVGPDDSVAVISFSSDVQVVSHLTKNRRRLREEVGRMPLPVGATCYYDALGYVLARELRGLQGQRNAVVTLTDGQDNSIARDFFRQALAYPLRSLLLSAFGGQGSFLSFEQLRDGVIEAGALVYTVQLTPWGGAKSGVARSTPAGSPVARVYEDISNTARKQAEELARLSGGRLFPAGRVEDLAGIYELVAGDLRTVYSVAYSPSNGEFNGAWREIRVEVSRPGTVLRARRGYCAR